MVIALHAAVHDCCIPLLTDALSRNVRIDPVWEAPHRRIDLTKLHGRAGVVLYRVLESIAEIAVIEKHVRIVEPPVEMSFDGLDRLNDTLQLLVSRENDERSVGARSIHLWVQTSVGEDLVVLLADSSEINLQLASQRQRAPTSLISRTEWMEAHRPV